MVDPPYIVAQTLERAGTIDDLHCHYAYSEGLRFFVPIPFQGYVQGDDAYIPDIWGIRIKGNHLLPHDIELSYSQIELVVAIATIAPLKFTSGSFLRTGAGYRSDAWARKVYSRLSDDLRGIVKDYTLSMSPEEILEPHIQFLDQSVGLYSGITSKNIRLSQRELKILLLLMGDSKNPNEIIEYSYDATKTGLYKLRKSLGIDCVPYQEVNRWRLADHDILFPDGWLMKDEFRNNPLDFLKHL